MNSPLAMINQFSPLFEREGMVDDSTRRGVSSKMDRQSQLDMTTAIGSGFLVGTKKDYLVTAMTFDFLLVNPYKGCRVHTFIPEANVWSDSELWVNGDRSSIRHHSPDLFDFRICHRNAAVRPVEQEVKSADPAYSVPEAVNHDHAARRNVHLSARRIAVESGYETCRERWKRLSLFR